MSDPILTQTIRVRLESEDGRVLGYLISEVVTECEEQALKWGPAAERGISVADWSAILSEEVLEVMQAVNKQDLPNLREELVQVAAVCVSFITALDARIYDALHGCGHKRRGHEDAK